MSRNMHPLTANDPTAAISGYTGTWYGWHCVLQLTLHSQSGQTYVAFKGSTITVPLASGERSNVVAGLEAVFA